MCNQPGMPITGYAEGGEIELPPTGVIGGRTVGIASAEDDIPGIIELARGLATEGVALPEQMLAGFNPDQRAAFDLAVSGIGSYKPYLERATALTEEGVGALQGSLEATRGLAGEIPGAIAPGQEALARGMSGADIAANNARASTAEAQRALQEASGFGLESARAGIAGLAPEAAAGYMNQFEDAAVQQALADIARQGELQKQNVAFQAEQSGAFGGSRQAIAEQELGRNVLEQQGRTAAQMRQAGFDAAANRALQSAQAMGQLGQIGSSAAANAAQAGGQLGLSAEQLAQESAFQSGNLGLQSANLGLSGIQAGLGAQQQAAGIGQGISGLGQQMAGLGQLGQQMNLQDINTMSTVGQQQQAQTQAGLDTAYQNQYQQAMQPYQQLAFLSDITTGAPSGQMTSSTQPGPSVGSQILGAGIGAYGLSQSGMFG
mgnify:FL=1